MLQKIKSRKHLLFIAAVLLSLSFIVAITAYLTDKDNYTTTIRTASKDDIDIAITGEAVEGLVTLGEEVELNPVISNNGQIPVYVFAEVEADAALTPELSDGWQEYEAGVYYYGDESGLTELDSNSTTTVFDSITVDAEPEQNVEVTEDLNLSINAYAIQTGGFDNTDIGTLWDLVSTTP